MPNFIKAVFPLTSLLFFCWIVTQPIYEHKYSTVEYNTSYQEISFSSQEKKRIHDIYEWLVKASNTGQSLIQKFEDLKLVAYMPTPNDVPTIGFGTTRINGRPVKLGQKISYEDAQQYFRQDLKFFEDVVNNSVKVPLSQNQFDALVSFVYNVGDGAFKNSTLLRLLNTGDYSGASKEFLKWNKQAGKVLRGLTVRRELEKQLFAKDLSSGNNKDSV